MVRVTFFLFKTSMEVSQFQLKTLTFLFTSYRLITFANSMVPDEAQQNIGHDLDPNSLKLTHVIPDFFVENVN